MNIKRYVVKRSRRKETIHKVYQNPNLNLPYI